MAGGEAIYFSKVASQFEITSSPGATRLALTNTVALLIRPGDPAKVPIGIKIENSGDLAMVLSGVTCKKVACHVGLIDPGFRGELCLIIANKRGLNVTLFPGELCVYVTGFRFAHPNIPAEAGLCRPQYHKDAGFDFYAPSQTIIYPQSRAVCVRRGVRPEFLSDYVPVVFGRSGLACRGIFADVCAWKRHSPRVTLYNYGPETFEIKTGERMCQIVFMHKTHVSRHVLSLAPSMRLSKKLFFSWAQVPFVDAPPPRLSSIGEINERGGAGFGSTGL